MSVKQKSFANTAKGIIDKLALRGMEGYYAESKEDALTLISSMIPEGATIANGGSETLKEVGVFKLIQSGNYEFHDRMMAKTPEEKKEMNAKLINSDYFLMSTNAITLDGVLVNIDGLGNRVSYLIYGPENVIVVAGMNKVSTDVESALKRVRNIASPPNALRLSCNTPCAKVGHCTDCLSTDCICCEVVVTRKSRIKNRIKVILVGEELGF